MSRPTVRVGAATIIISGSKEEVQEYMWAERDNLPTPLFRPFKQYVDYIGGESV